MHVLMLKNMVRIDKTRLLNVKIIIIIIIIIITTTTILTIRIKISFLYQYNKPRGPSGFYNRGAMFVV